METIQEYVKRNKISMKTKMITSRQDGLCSDLPRHFKCTLKLGNRKMNTVFSQGSAYTEPPTVEDALDSLRRDSESVQFTSFKEFCDSMGYETDSIKALKIYKACDRIAGNLAKLLGKKAYCELFSTVEQT